MKKSFTGFYAPSNTKVKNAWRHEKTLFVFDTNVLLNLYSYTEEARDDFFKVLDVITDNIWIPHHVGLEYQRNRLETIKNEKSIFKRLNDDIDRISKTIESSEKAKELHASMQKTLNDLKQTVDEWNAKQPEVRSGDKIRPKIEKYFDGKVGQPFSQEKLNEIYNEGEKRYKNNVPPGYKDAKEKKDMTNFSYGGLEYIPMFGDLIIWKQIIEYAKQEDIKSVFFITDDTKEDWWYIIDSGGKKRIGVRAELREEIMRESKISLFEAMTTSSFMENGKEYLKLDVSDDSIEETKHLIKIKLSDFVNKKELEQAKRIMQNFDIDPLKNLREQIINNLSLDNYTKDLLSMQHSYRKNLLNEQNKLLSDQVKRQIEILRNSGVL